MRLDQIISSPLEEREISLESRDAVALTVEAATAQEGRGFFTSQNFGVHDGGRDGSGVVQPLRNKQQEIIMNKITSINGTLIASLNELNEHVENGTAHVTEEERTAWNNQTTVKAKGILIATQEDLDEHTGNKAIHVTEDERAAWNAKADAAALSAKADASSFNVHKDDAVVHITAKERETWNGKQDKLTDEAGNMTLDGGLTAQGGTFSDAVNANGGINIPLAAGAATNTAAVNRIHAAGLAAVAETYNLQIYLDAAITTTTNNAAVTERVSGQLMRVTVPARQSSSVNMGLDHSLIGRANYSKFGGFTLPVRMSAYKATIKITLGMGDGQVSVRTDRDVDDYTRVHTSAEHFGEVLDVTISDTRDSESRGYWVRVREIYYSRSAGRKFVKTTRALLPLDGNTAVPASISGLVYHQYRDGGWDTDNYGTLWLMTGGYDNRCCIRIANVRGIHTYNSVGFNACHLDIYNSTNATTVDIGAPRIMQRYMDGYNPAYYGFSAIEYNAIKSETIEDFIDPDTQDQA